MLEYWHTFATTSTTTTYDETETSLQTVTYTFNADNANMHTQKELNVTYIHLNWHPCVHCKVHRYFTQMQSYRNTNAYCNRVSNAQRPCYCPVGKCARWRTYIRTRLQCIWHGTLIRALIAMHTRTLSTFWMMNDESEYAFVSRKIDVLGRRLRRAKWCARVIDRFFEKCAYTRCALILCDLLFRRTTFFLIFPITRK